MYNIMIYYLYSCSMITAMSLVNICRNTVTGLFLFSCEEVS